MELIVKSGKFLGLNWQIDESGICTVSGVQTEDSSRKVVGMTMRLVDQFTAYKVNDVEPGTDIHTYAPWNAEGPNYDPQIRQLVLNYQAAGHKQCYMFAYANNVQRIVTGPEFDISNVTDISFMFANSKNLTEIQAGDWDVEAVTDMSDLFAGCENLVDLEIGDWNVKAVKYMSHMFRGCRMLQNLDIGAWSVENVIETNWMFMACEMLTGVSIGGWNVSHVEKMSSMFARCVSLKKLDLSHWVVKKEVAMDKMFAGCTSLEMLDLSSWDISNWDAEHLQQWDGFLENCTSLKSLKMPKQKFSVGADPVACKLLLFDLDGTLLRSDKTISNRTLEALRACREKGILIGVSTSRSESNSAAFIEELAPDIIISCGGALVKRDGEYISRAVFSAEETNDMIAIVRKICGMNTEITIDTFDAHYWNYKTDPKELDPSWGESIYVDYTDFHEPALKMCVEIPDERRAKMLARKLSQCDCARFSDGFWYKFTKKEATKEGAIKQISQLYGIEIAEVTAFGDDYSDVGMLKLCGLGVAMGNAIDEVKRSAELIIGSNDEDGIAIYLEETFLS